MSKIYFVRPVIFLFLLFTLIFTPRFAHAQTQQTLDQAVQGAARYLQDTLPKGTRAAIVAISAENQEIGEYAREKLSAVLVNGRWFTVVERNAAALESISKEMDRHLNFEVSEETELSIGKQLGAEIIISGSLSRSGQVWRLGVQAVKVESAQKVAQWAAESIRADSAWAGLVTPRTAGIVFDGDAMTVRDKKTVADGLRSAMQKEKVTLELDEKAAAEAGYSFNITVYRDAGGTAKNALIKAEISVEFSRNGRAICSAGPYYITETTEPLVARRIAERLKDDKTFFTKVNEAAGQ